MKDSQDRWVPMRDADVSNGRITYDRVSWDPSTVMHGAQILLNIDRIGRHMNKLGLKQDIYISSSNDVIKPDVSIANISKQGEASASPKRTITPLPPGQVLYSPSSSSTTIGVNFQGISQAIESNIPNGNSNPHFYKTYARGVETSIRGSLYEVVSKQNDLDPELHKKWVGEVGNLLFLILPVLTAASLSLMNPAQSIEINRNLLIGLLPYRSLVSFAEYMASFYFSDDEGPYFQHLRSHHQRLIYPDILVDQIVKPKLATAIPLPLVKAASINNK